MELHQFALSKAGMIFDYFYNQALVEFGPENARRLGQIPADYVYNKIITSGGNCYINSDCCLKYCNEVLDHNFERFDPELKKLIYENASGIKIGNVSDREINNKLRSFRRKGSVNKIYNDSVNRFRNEREDDLSRLMSSVKLNKRPSYLLDDLDFKKLKLH
jgi:hypothetical protein